MARSTLVTAALAGALALGALAPAFAQDNAPRPPRSAEIKLDFGMGRKVDIKCGELALADCIATSQALIEKVSTTQVMPPFKGDRPKGGPKGAHQYESKPEDKPEPPKP